MAQQEGLKQQRGERETDRHAGQKIRTKVILRQLRHSDWGEGRPDLD
jgi:hypothetical protein